MFIIYYDLYYINVSRGTLFYIYDIIFKFSFLDTKYSVDLLINVKQNRDVSRETSLQ
jgi:hypothetical protein